MNGQGKPWLWFIAGFALALIIGATAATSYFAAMSELRNEVAAEKPKPVVAGVDLSKNLLTIFPKFPLSYSSALRSLARCEYFPTVDESTFLGETGISVTLWGITNDATMDYMRIESPNASWPPLSQYTPIGHEMKEIGMPANVVRRTAKETGRKIKGGTATYSWIEPAGGVADIFFFAYANGKDKCVGFRVTVLPKEAQLFPGEVRPVGKNKPAGASTGAPISGFINRNQ